MTLQQWLAVSVLASLPFSAFSAHAQQRPQSRHPIDATTPVPAPAYASSFERYQAIAAEAQSPAAAWREANDEMARLKGHAGHMKNPAAALPLPRPDDSGHAPAPAPTPVPTPSADHSTHH